MATNSVRGKREASNSEEEEEEDDEEALSLCDLPDNLNKEEDQARKADSHQAIEAQEEFDFRLWVGPFCKESEMCVADEVFFQGQILPLRKSFSSETSVLLPTGFNRCESSRSGSMDHGSVMSEFRSYSSRSSSIRSQNSSSSTSSNTTITTPEICKPRMRNQFHTHPSPKPQLKVSNSRHVSFGHLNRKSSAWDFFRLGVVPAPEIGLQDLKVRCTNSANKNSVSRNSSSSSSSNSTFVANGISEGAKMSSRDKSNHSFKQLVGKGGGFLSGCKCSIETVPLDIMIKSGTKSTNKTESTTHAMKEKVKQKQRQKQGKKAMSRRRTFEWIKELSLASYGYPDEEALLLNS